ncbi:MAG: endoglucanase, partial [Oscillospiraceae bacterium]|nr:endoglucanase [Oscillospiraceae bacterium]
VNAIDLSLLKQVLLGSERTDIDRKAADWNEDEAINAEDANGILAFLLQKEM